MNEYDKIYWSIIEQMRSEFEYELLSGNDIDQGYITEDYDGELIYDSEYEESEWCQLFESIIIPGIEPMTYNVSHEITPISDLANILVSMGSIGIGKDALN